MTINRREFLNVTTVAIATEVLATSSRAAAGPSVQASIKAPIKAIAFDAFPIFDPRPIVALAESIFPGKGAELGNVWRTRQFEYQWLRALSGRYADFRQTTEDALSFSCELLQLDLTPARRDRLMNAYLSLPVWPDVPAALEALKTAGLRLAFVSNATRAILDAGIRNAGLERVFEHVLSTDQIRTYKPDPRAYQLAIDAFGLRREEILFVPFAGWDVAGAKSFGYATYWVNRQNQPVERLGVVPDATGRTLTDLVGFLTAA